MDVVVFDNISLKIDTKKLNKKLKANNGSFFASRVEELAKEAEKIAKPKGLFKLSYIDTKGENFIVVEDEKLVSRVLRVNVDKVGRIFLFLATCGREIEDWSKNYDDMLDTFIVDNIMELACKEAQKIIFNYIDDKYDLKNASKMNPGSLSNWPIKEQRKIFRILKNSNEKIGVELTDSLLMKPAKTVSGIRFSSEVKFENCQLCPKDKCPNRAAPYNKQLYAARYGLGK
ncbi:vitamin B12 dependent-methionine synthase activation domain-containing protein [Maledivibacter halophilus]|uniref:Vitamin B12 dependent methionine synthase, activation domain n=1 Tax=Maledivibacter halophilus TaxID=36842 RepID=A0A1T5IJS5_9FIRM|nr:vitamin B12 dependent-methionine synthase activation domain-containing protein [Maledivibacter halophilus]SKC39360.1 Vitamin B12 dependent methionine synthase, activation domain [Maledivibacter halophilus]